MTDNPNRAYAGDCRRAAAIAVHHANRSVEGINVLVAETKQLNRAIELPHAVHDVLDVAARAILTPRGLVTLHASFRAVADDEENPYRLAAQYIVGRIDDDEEQVVDVLNAVRDGQGTTLIIGMLNLYESAVPLMFTPFSIEAFQATAAQLFAAENGTDE